MYALVLVDLLVSPVFSMIHAVFDILFQRSCHCLARARKRCTRLSVERKKKWTARFWPDEDGKYERFVIVFDKAKRIKRALAHTHPESYARHSNNGISRQHQTDCYVISHFSFWLVSAELLSDFGVRSLLWSRCKSFYFSVCKCSVLALYS